MDYPTLIASVAAVCTTVSFLPQVIKVYRTKHTRDLSLPMYTIFCLGVFLWLWYGVLVKSPPIIIANAVTFVLALYIAVMKIIFG